MSSPLYSFKGKVTESQQVLEITFDHEKSLTRIGIHLGAVGHAPSQGIRSHLHQNTICNRISPYLTTARWEAEGYRARPDLN